MKTESFCQIQSRDQVVFNMPQIRETGQSLVGQSFVNDFSDCISTEFTAGTLKISKKSTTPDQKWGSFKRE